MKKFTTYIKENIEEISDLDSEIRSLIENSLKTSDLNTVEDFILAYKKDSETNQIEGLINNSDIYDFYLKFKDDIDSTLNKNDFYLKPPSEINVISLYDYVIVGTKESVKIIINNFGKVQVQKDF